MEIKTDGLIRQMPNQTRPGWNEKFREMAKQGDDVLLDADLSLSDWDQNEWQWPAYTETLSEDDQQAVLTRRAE